MRAPAALVALALLVGSALGLLLHDRVPDALAFCAAGGAGLACLAALASIGNGHAGECAACVACGCLLSGTALGLDAARRAYDPPLRRWFEQHQDGDGPVQIDGVLREDAVAGPSGVSLTIDVGSIRNISGAGESAAATGGVRLSVSGALAATRIPEWRGGRCVRLTGFLREPAVYRTPGVPDNRPALARRGIILVGSVKSAALVEILAPGSLVAEAAGECRAWARARLHGAVGRWSARSAAIASAILLGDRSGLDDSDERRLQEAGTYHVIAISGGNIAMLTLLLLGACRLLRAPPRLAAAAVILILLFYSRITGPAPSVDRAVTAAVAYLAGRLLDQRGPATNTLAIAATLALAASPSSVLDPGFILSFGATLGILLMVPAIAARLTLAIVGAATVPRRRSQSRGVAGRLAGLSTWTAVTGLLAATFAAELSLAPVGAALFGRITVAGICLNFAAIPLMTIVQAAGIAVLLVPAAVEPWFGLVGYVVHAASTALVESARLVDVMPWLSRAVPPPAWWLLASYYAALVVALTPVRVGRVARFVVAAAGLLMAAGSQATARDAVAPPPPGWLRVVVLDVGQGDATYIRLPDGRAFLVDTGGLPSGMSQEPLSAGRGGFEVGERVVTPALRAFGTWRLDTLVLTHGDPDHIGGAQSVLRAFVPRAVWEGVRVPPHAAVRALAEAAGSAGAEWRTVQAGDAVRIAGVELRVLHPPRPEWERQRVRNEDSVVLDLRFGDVSIVLPGDIGREGEHALLPLFQPLPLVVLKAAHHGSATSSTREFLEAARPDVAIFSAGRGNRFGHPAPPVVARFEALGTPMFSTAEDGAVFVDTDGERVDVWGWAGRRASFTTKNTK